MSMFKIFDTAASGMSAQSLRLNLVASNMANVDAVSSSIDETYRARQPVFRAMVDQFNPDAPAVGVSMVGVIESQAPLIREYAPDHQMADEAGYIFRPNVNPVEEMANMISASRSYQGNVEVASAAKQLLMATLRMGQ
ncbi:flagellar basal body rod protein FlgC [Candidatus Endoriftia persephone str. Guaymas]|jgi:flagellar basal-body rod protein FlgC|uniref:Flagellar basal-body rod protein FlgC n=3 Tax=Gammaproteobacteria TaxID=1236 RepID=G2FB40_9GAMM|nr:flagellar basal body rod protein FlgC [Candidatus Endoriftia persephone]EGV51090.1 flagellar basal-body rod protein flgC [endosymbiont of Riftia pachyptila (vent Ph05)]EGW55978.1 flagellar basal-body rod protein FlgC [endosymbiont of Tevnia jerichonana (vent Tica)]MBA1332469.1 flagellar basal body rod protein FlgC [Candidatus Endoriftia persephone str. Guaymas]USF88110.1 flagellar basal body rod protein FlgC [Candidatus Endoriftia persephone]